MSEPPNPPTRRLLIAVAVPALAIPLAVALSTYWHVPTHVHLDLATTRLAFTPGGEEPQEILNRSVPFSSLTLVDCGRVTFTADLFEIADPALLVPATRAEEEPHFPPTAWRRLSVSGPVRFSCREPGAKLTFQSPGHSGGGVGILDRFPLSPGREVIVELAPTPSPPSTSRSPIPGLSPLSRSARKPSWPPTSPGPRGSVYPSPAAPRPTASASRNPAAPSRSKAAEG